MDTNLMLAIIYAIVIMLSLASLIQTKNLVYISLTTPALYIFIAQLTGCAIANNKDTTISGFAVLGAGLSLFLVVTIIEDRRKRHSERELIQNATELHTALSITGSRG